MCLLCAQESDRNGHTPIPLTKVPALRKRKLPSGKSTYIADFYVDGKRSRRILGPRKDLAEKQAAKIFHDLQNEQAGQNPLPVTSTLQELVDRFLRAKGRRTCASSRFRDKSDMALKPARGRLDLTGDEHTWRHTFASHRIMME